MKLGLHVSDFTWPNGPASLGTDLAAIAQAAEAAGFDRLSVMDHFFQIHMLGPPEHEMLATSDFTVKLVAPAVGDRFVGRGRVVARTGATTISRADVFAVKDNAETMIATGLVSMRALSRSPR